MTVAVDLTYRVNCLLLSSHSFDNVRAVKGMKFSLAFGIHDVMDVGSALYVCTLLQNAITHWYTCRCMYITIKERSWKRKKMFLWLATMPLPGKFRVMLMTIGRFKCATYVSSTSLTAARCWTSHVGLPLFVPISHRDPGQSEAGRPLYIQCNYRSCPKRCMWCDILFYVRICLNSNSKLESLPSKEVTSHSFSTHTPWGRARLSSVLRMPMYCIICAYRLGGWVWIIEVYAYVLNEWSLTEKHAASFYCVELPVNRFIMPKLGAT